MDVLLIYLVLLLLLGTFAYAGLSAAPWVPTRKRHIDRALSLADMKQGETFVDLGCGDGRLVVAAARRGFRSIGYEISLIPYLLALVRRFPVRDRCQIRYQSLWKADLRNADVVYIFLMPESTDKLIEKFRREMKPGSRIISYVWQLHGWEPEKIDVVKNDLKLYLYRV